MKCERKNAKLEQFEEMVDDIMDWIYDTEFLLTYVVESTYNSVKERAEQFEVRLFHVNAYVTYLRARWLGPLPKESARNTQRFTH